MTLTDKEKLNAINRIITEEWRKPSMSNVPQVVVLLEEIRDIIDSKGQQYLTKKNKKDGKPKEKKEVEYHESIIQNYDRCGICCSYSCGLLGFHR